MSRWTGLARTAAGFLRTPKGKRAAGGALDRAASLADRATKQRYSARIDRGRRAAAQGLERL